MDLVNLNDLSNLAGVAETNVRRYIKHFPAYIPVTPLGKLKMYSTDSIPVIQFIASRYLAHTPTDLIRVELEQDPRWEITLDMEVPVEVHHATTPEMGLSVEVFGQMAQAVAQQNEILRQMVQALDQSRELEDLRQRVESMEDRNRKLDEVLRKLNEKKGLVQRVKEFLGRN